MEIKKILLMTCSVVVSLIFICTIIVIIKQDQTPVVNNITLDWYYSNRNGKLYTTVQTPYNINWNTTDITNLPGKLPLNPSNTMAVTIIAKYKLKNLLYPTLSDENNSSCYGFHIIKRHNSICLAPTGRICVECVNGQNCIYLRDSEFFVVIKNISEYKNVHMNRCQGEWKFAYLKKQCVCSPHHSFIFTP